MRPRRKTEGFNLAFLDIMSCGLGAIILVFMLVKHNVEKSVDETELLKADLENLSEQESELRSHIATLQDKKAAAAEKIQTTLDEISKTQSAIAERQSELSRQQSEKQTLEEAIKSIEVPKPPDVIEVPRVGEEDYIIGLRVEGRKIGILVDSSSSMTDAILIDIIRRKNGSASDKKSGPKWQRTKRVVNWLLARVPEGSDVSVVAFNSKATVLGGQAWSPGSDAAALKRILNDLDSLVPNGATNLEAGLAAISAQNPTDIYVITDGLPTEGDSSYKSLNPFANCSALWGGASTISGECRAKLFRHTVNRTALSGVRVNVVLLPIEGDPEASNEFWQWTSRTRGVLISPAASWP